MINFTILPLELVYLIDELLRGSRRLYQEQFSRIVSKISLYPQSKLNPVKTQFINNTIMVEIEDNVFCHKCGEKTLWFPFMLNNNYYCDNCQLINM